MIFKVKTFLVSRGQYICFAYQADVRNYYDAVFFSTFWVSWVQCNVSVDSLPKIMWARGHQMHTISGDIQSWSKY